MWRCRYFGKLLGRLDTARIEAAMVRLVGSTLGQCCVVKACLHQTGDVPLDTFPTLAALLKWIRMPAAGFRSRSAGPHIPHRKHLVLADRPPNEARIASS